MSSNRCLSCFTLMSNGCLTCFSVLSNGCLTCFSMLSNGCLTLVSLLSNSCPTCFFVLSNGCLTLASACFGVCGSFPFCLPSPFLGFLGSRSGASGRRLGGCGLPFGESGHAQMCVFSLIAPSSTRLAKTHCFGQPNERLLGSLRFLIVPAWTHGLPFGRPWGPFCWPK